MKRRTSAGEAKDEWIGLRVTAADLARIKKKQEAGYKIGGYLRALALGSAGPLAVKHPRVEREQLARLIGPDFVFATASPRGSVQPPIAPSSGTARRNRR